MTSFFDQVYRYLIQDMDEDHDLWLLFQKTLFHKYITRDSFFSLSSLIIKKINHVI